jgi:FAD/FMN-containing dehydrogenase
MEPTPSSETLREQLRNLIGTDRILTESQDTAALLIDHRHLYSGHALAIALPGSVEEVSRLLRFCHEQRIGVVPQGGNTGYCGGATPDESGRQLLLLLRRLNRIRSVDAANYSMTVEAGCVLAQIQRAAAAADRFFPLSLGSEGSCQIGGNLATNAGGLNVVRYGMARALVLGIEAVLADGSIVHGLKSLHKDNTGYDLKSLLIGSEGTLGVITAATLKLWPAMRSSATAFVAIETPEQALALLQRLRAAADERLSSFELLPRVAIEITTRHISGTVDPLERPSPWYVLCELTSPADEPLSELLQQTLAEAAESGVLSDAALASSERERAALWRLRESVPEAQRHAGASLKHDVSVPVASLPPFIHEAAAWVQGQVPEGYLVCYGHAGDGNLHFNVNALPGAGNALLSRESSIRRAIHDIVSGYQGSISAEHGIGRLKREELQRYADPAALAAMRSIKQALDPHGIMNPGKLL